MHGTHEGRLTPTRYPRIPWYSCMSMACTRSADADDIPAKPTIPVLTGHCASEHGRYSLFLFCRAIVLLDTLVTLYFFFAGPLCFWTRSAIVLLDTLITLYFFFAGPLCLWTRSLR
ncbi:hypothetical protein EV363DRAFT_1331513 [Boletus edulis]|nr:hypothetical protein EV363DRAFT_1331513 [Boletus edulis]